MLNQCFLGVGEEGKTLPSKFTEENQRTKKTNFRCIHQCYIYIYFEVVVVVEVELEEEEDVKN